MKLVLDKFVLAHPGELAALAAALSWSCAVICMRIGGLHVASFAFNAFKTCFAALCFLAVYPFSGGAWLYPLSSWDWLRLIISALLGIVVADLLFLMALHRLGAMLCAMASCFFPIFAMLCAWAFYGELMPAAALLGTGTVLLAVVLCSYRQEHVSGLNRSEFLRGFLLAIGSEFFMAVAVIMIRDIYRQVPVLWVASVRFLFAGAVMLPLLVLGTGRQRFWETVLPRGARRYVLLGSFLGPFLATILWFLGYKYTLAGKAATLNKLSTFFIFLLAALFLKEPVTLRRAGAVVLAFLGAALVTYG